MASGANDEHIAAAYFRHEREDLPTVTADLGKCLCHPFLFGDGCLVGAKVEVAGYDTLQGVDTDCATRLVPGGLVQE